MQDELGDELEAAVLGVVRSQQFIGGAKVAEFERAFADYLGAAEVIGVANGTDAIELSLKALNLAPGAEALVPANTFIATAEAVVAAGLDPAGDRDDGGGRQPRLPRPGGRPDDRGDALRPDGPGPLQAAS